MEKIYMEEQKQQQKKSIWDVSVTLSFVVAAFALVSLVAFGMSNIQGSGISYAAPTSITGDTFDFHRGQYVYGMKSDGTAEAGGANFRVPLLSADENWTQPVFCIEHTALISDSVVKYKKYKEIDDYGFLHILNNSLVNGKEMLGGLTFSNASAKPYVEAWATQVAIWLYQAEKNPNESVHAITDSDKNIIQNVAKFAAPGGITTTVSGVYPKIRALVDSAKQVSGSRMLSVSKADGEISKSTDNKYYQSTLISVTGNPAEFFQSYDISLSGVDGAIVVDENGKTISSLTNVPKATKFYVRVPIDNVTQAVQNLQVNVTGHFDTLAGSFYQAADNASLQKVVSVTGATKNVAEGVSIEFVGAPDTGMNNAQTVYFIGLIVLLCGVGIVYANAKPVENKQ